MDNETENVRHEKISLNVGKQIQKLRLDKKMTQKELATKLNLKQSEITSIENGSCLNNKQLINKIKTYLQKKIIIFRMEYELKSIIDSFELKIDKRKEIKSLRKYYSIINNIYKKINKSSKVELLSLEKILIIII